MPARTAEREEFLADIIITATEGGTNYWARSRAYHYDGDPKFTHVEFCDMELEGTAEEKWNLVNVDVVARGLQKVLDPEFKLSSLIRDHIRLANNENDAGEIDAGAADIIVQAGMFGEIVYG
jgi:hypothetical protein